MVEGLRPNLNAINQLNIMDEEWELSNSPQRDDLKLLCEQNVRTFTPLHTNSKNHYHLKKTGELPTYNNL